MIETFINSLKLRRELSPILKRIRGERSIILIAGHNRAGFWHWVDRGALCPFESTNEHYECEKLVYGAREILERDGFRAIFAPFDLSFRQKIAWVNKNFPADSILLSIHLNAHHLQAATGTETWYLSGSDRARSIAKEIQATLVQSLGLKDRGVKGDLQNHHGSLGILRDTHTFDEWLLELGFITNANDLKRVRKCGVQAIADAAKFAFHFDHQRDRNAKI